MSYEVARVLQDAAEVLEKDGWTQGAWNTRTYLPKCSMGALRSVADSLFDQKVHLAAEAICRTMGVEETEFPTGRLILWNDHADRTKQEVIDTFHLAAKQEMRKADGVIE